MTMLEKALLVCPTYNPGALFEDWAIAFNKQNNKPATTVIIDSSSGDGTVEKARALGFNVNVIKKSEFNHGATRQKVIDENPEYEFIIFLTQDAFLCGNNELKTLLSPFKDKEVAAVCGRQLPHMNSSRVAAHSRCYNYADTSRSTTLADAESIGVRAAFISNSFAAYRSDALKVVGGFPHDVIFGEDMFVAAELLMAGYKIAYNAEACVRHSHDYSMKREFQRYFDMGVFHAREPWIRENFGTADREGLKFIASEVKYLASNAFWELPGCLARTVLRYSGFRLGIIEKYIPLSIKELLCMNKGYFTKS